ncbi:hypothetical protein BG653_04775 [Streptomyces platensis]|uniref:Lipoprotein n=2 Tax=Streptomyces platensis TaxID=58346 RepID=A0ABX3XSR4_STRPT|nr:hypothetical protein BG653_04775 [Streptomyces platensis]
MRPLSAIAAVIPTASCAPYSLQHGSRCGCRQRLATHDDPSGVGVFLQS